MIWNHGLELLNDFLTHLNLCHQTIKFMSKISQSKIVFLDTTVLIDDTNKLYTDLYCKQTRIPISYESPSTAIYLELDVFALN